MQQDHRYWALKTTSIRFSYLQTTENKTYSSSLEGWKPMMSQKITAQHKHQKLKQQGNVDVQ